jgi:hypothetical protein
MSTAKEYAKRSGPLPTNGNRIGSAFWRGYLNGHCVAAKGSPAWKAYEAGLERRRVEPGLKP